MKHRNPALLYFSFDKNRRKSFWNTIHNNGINYQDIALFQCLNRGISYNNIADLVMFLNRYEGDYQALHIIVDILSFDTTERKSQIELLRDAIVSYPEVQFLFDGRLEEELDIKSCLFFDEETLRKKYRADFPTGEWNLVKNKIYSSFLNVYWEKEALKGKAQLLRFFYRIICGRDNTFDATNLRYAIKYWKYTTLRVDKNRNFSKIQDSRSESLAICVEEETNQNMFVSYALYKNGYRVYPVTSAGELKALNEDIVDNRKISRDSAKNIIILRDYDLQFEDEGGIVDQVRGYKHCTKEEIAEYNKENNEENNEENKGANYYHEGWTNLLENKDIDDNANSFWNNLKQNETYFITKGPRFSKVIPPYGNKKSYISDDNATLYISGFQKPVSGLYLPFHKIRAIEKRFSSTRQMGVFATARNKHDHSTPLDIYDMINRMLKRAERYFDDGRYRLAALISGEAIELMNGFHQRLMVKANYINARAENAIAMDIVGGDEEALAADALFRIGMIKDDINRIYLTEDIQKRNRKKGTNAENKDGQETNKEHNVGNKRKPASDIRSVNVLNLIYNECRNFCKEHEHFVSEDRFLSAIGHLNEGRPLGALWKEIIGLVPLMVKAIKNTYVEMVNYINDTPDNEQ